jgi:hypothetical protein
MEPIISPWFVYLVGILGGFGSLLLVASVISVVAAVIFVMINVICADDRNGAPDIVKDNVKKLVIWAVTISMVTVLVPDRKTVIAMAVANEITTDRLVGAGEFVVDIKDGIKRDIIEIISEFDEDVPAEVAE